MSDYRRDQERLMRELETRMQILELREQNRAETWTRLRSTIIDNLRRLGIPDDKSAAILPSEFPPDDWQPS
jgi:hypothetical protein